MTSSWDVILHAMAPVTAYLPVLPSHRGFDALRWKRAEGKHHPPVFLRKNRPHNKSGKTRTSHLQSCIKAYLEFHQKGVVFLLRSNWLLMLVLLTRELCCQGTSPVFILFLFKDSCAPKRVSYHHFTFDGFLAAKYLWCVEKPHRRGEASSALFSQHVKSTPRHRTQQEVAWKQISFLNSFNESSMHPHEGEMT